MDEAPGMTIGEELGLVRVAGTEGVSEELAAGAGLLDAAAVEEVASRCMNACRLYRCIVTSSHTP